jgi:ABC-2 type transport system permease protein
MVLLMVGVLVFQGWLSGRGDSFTVAVTDPSAVRVVAEAERTLQAGEGEGEVEVEALTAPDQERARSLVLDGEADALLVRGGDTWTLAADGDPDGSLRQALAAAVRVHVLEQRAAEAGTSADVLLAGAELTTEDLSGGTPGSSTVHLLVGFFFAFLFYVSSIMFGMSIASSVVEEKQSRVVEIMAAAVPTSQLLLGKIVGTTVLAVGQLVLIVGAGLVGSTFTQFDVFLPGIAGTVAWYVPFFLAGFLALACVWAGVGAMASRTEDLQSSTSPLTLALVAAFIAGLSLEGVAREIGSFVPILSTLLMPARVLAGEAAWWEPPVALAITLAFAAATIWAGSRLYQRSVLHTQGRLGWRAAWRMTD